MAVQDDIAAALARIASATDALNNVGAQATGAIAQVTSAYTARMNSLQTSFFVNAITGSDTNPGTEAAPFKTMKEAINRTPYGGYCRINLRSAYTVTFAENLVIPKHDVLVIGDGATRFQVSFERRVNANTAPNSREAAGIKLQRGSTMNFASIELVVPPLDSFSAYQDNGAGSLFTASQTLYGFSAVSFLSCNINIPATPFGSIFGPVLNLALSIEAATLNGATTSLNGRLLSGQTNTAGVASNTIPGLVTNLATI